jgi:hypothetical protein
MLGSCHLHSTKEEHFKNNSWPGRGVIARVRKGARIAERGGSGNPETGIAALALPQKSCKPTLI